MHPASIDALLLTVLAALATLAYRWKEKIDTWDLVGWQRALQTLVAVLTALILMEIWAQGTATWLAFGRAMGWK
jgi:hypothetical protein